MDRQIESNCLGLLENYRTLAAGNRMEFTEMVLACAGIYLAAGASPDMERLKACKTLLKSKAGIFSNFRGTDELLVRCKMALAPDPERYFESVENAYQRIKTFFSGEQTVLAAMILAEQGGADSPGRTPPFTRRRRRSTPFSKAVCGRTKTRCSCSATFSPYAAGTGRRNARSSVPWPLD